MSELDTVQTEKFVGKRVKDIYGRYVGYVVGIETGPYGEVVSVGVDRGDKGFHEFQIEYLSFENDMLILTPPWKVDTEEFAREVNIVMRRIKAVEDLFREGEVSREERDEALKQYVESLKDIQADCQALREMMEKRLVELDEQEKNLHRFLTSIKIQYKSGEISAESFRSSTQFTNMLIDKIGRERKDIQEAQNLLKQPSTVEETSGILSITTQEEGMEDQLTGENNWLSKFLAK